MLASLDTEFTDLVIRPRLLSVGVVTDRSLDREFYAEVTDPDRLLATGRFGRLAVLPQFGKVAGAACSHADLGRRLAAFLSALAVRLVPGDLLVLAHGHRLDWELIELAIEDAGVSGWASFRHLIRPLNVYQFAGFDAGERAAQAYFKTQEQAPFSRHHALCDARALRLPYEAALQMSEPNHPEPRRKAAPSIAESS